MKHALIALTFLFLSGRASAQGAYEFCNLMADYALVTRAMAIDKGIDRSVAERVLARIYRAQDADAATVMRQVRDMAYDDTREAEPFAVDLGSRCLRGGGNPAAFLGTGT